MTQYSTLNVKVSNSDSKIQLSKMIESGELLLI